MSRPMLLLSLLLSVRAVKAIYDSTSGTLVALRASGGARNVPLEWPQGEITTHMRVAVST